MAFSSYLISCVLANRKEGLTPVFWECLVIYTLIYRTVGQVLASPCDLNPLFSCIDQIFKYLLLFFKQTALV